MTVNIVALNWCALPHQPSPCQKIFGYLRPIADTALARFNRPLVVRIRDKAAESKGRRFGNDVRAVLSILFGWGSERGHLADNPAAGIKDIRQKRGAPERNRPWSDEDRHAVLDAMPPHMAPALTLPRSFYRAGEIATRRAKTGEPVFWPVPSPLAAILDVAPQHSATPPWTSSAGTPWTLNGFRASRRQIRMRLEKAGTVGPGLTLDGLRHTVAVILREIRHDERTIADALGQKTLEMARHDAKGAELRPKMRGVVTGFDAEVNRRRTGVVEPGN
ncbi:integrase [Methylobacterium sp. CB376]|uniref:integrase n=1 Tax=unclassified Methylobacterium TaxID=2615210 RepID=UPI000152DDC6|nr:MULTISPECIES: integrase [Methylobacterium]WFT82655.1 integrase [Methylobacterium nodulans]